MGSRVKRERRLTNTPSGELVAFQHSEYRVDILPPPNELEKYEAMYPGTAKIILDTYIAQSEHRMKLETTVVMGDNKRADRGQIISAALSFLCIGSGALLTFLGKNVVGLSLIFGSIGTLLTAFYGGAIIRKIERKNKQDKMNP